MRPWIENTDWISTCNKAKQSQGPEFDSKGRLSVFLCRVCMFLLMSVDFLRVLQSLNFPQTGELFQVCFLPRPCTTTLDGYGKHLLQLACICTERRKWPVWTTRPLSNPGAQVMQALAQAQRLSIHIHRSRARRIRQSQLKASQSPTHVQQEAGWITLR